MRPIQSGTVASTSQSTSIAGVIEPRGIGRDRRDAGHSGLEHALLAEQAAGADGDDRDQQNIHRQQRPFRRIGAGQADREPDQKAGDTAPQKLPTPPSTITRNAGIDRIDAHMRTDAPDRRDDDAGDGGQHRCRTRTPRGAAATD